LQKELEEAAKDTRAISPDRLKDVAAGGAFFATSVPSRVLVKFVSASNIDPLDFISDSDTMRCMMMYVQKVSDLGPGKQSSVSRWL
jgi:hypothetical protein